MNEEKKTENLNTKVEGPDAINALFDALGKEGIDKSNFVFNLVDKVNKLETEIEVLKDLISRAINVKETKVIKG